MITEELDRKYANINPQIRCELALVSHAGPKKIPQRLFVLWLILYMFVGTQMAWILRPFIGSPKMTFTVFRPRSGNFHESVMYSVRDLFRSD